MNNTRVEYLQYIRGITPQDHLYLKNGIKDENWDINTLEILKRCENNRIDLLDLLYMVFTYEKPLELLLNNKNYVYGLYNRCTIYFNYIMRYMLRKAPCNIVMIFDGSLYNDNVEARYYVNKYLISKNRGDPKLRTLKKLIIYYLELERILKVV
jgi:hypothetical protein